METTKKLSQVRKGERVNFTGLTAAEDASPIREDGRVHVPWAEGGGCLVEDRLVVVLDEALEALRAIPTVAASIGREDRSLRPLIAEYQARKAATAPNLHANFQTSAHEYAATHQAAAQVARRIARWHEVEGGEGADAATTHWLETARHHESRIAEALMS